MRLPHRVNAAETLPLPKQLRIFTEHMKSKFVLALVALFVAAASAQQYSLAPTTNGTAIITFTNSWFNGVSTLQGKLGRKWVPLKNFYTTNRFGTVELPLPAGYSTYRVKSMSVVPGNAFSRLAYAYGNISTEGGIGPTPAGTNLWVSAYEGAFATNVPLSTPRAAVSDGNGNIYVVEEAANAVVVITNGRVYTAVGQLEQRGAGEIDLPTGPPAFPAVTPPATPDNPTFPVLNKPSALYYSGGTLYILDSGNARVLKYRNGLVSKLFSETGVGLPASLAKGGGLWVSGDEQEAFYTDGNVVKRWQAEDAENGVGGVSLYPGLFADAADIALIPTVHDSNPVVVDRGLNTLYRARESGVHRLIAGTGLTRGYSVGDVRRIALPGPTSVAPMPIGGYLIGTESARVWYVDTEGDAAPLIFGRAPTLTRPGAHTGDGRWFRRGGRTPKISSVESVNVAPNGDIILLEGGYVRRIEFLRLLP